jgi:hypothetical protein
MWTIGPSFPKLRPADTESMMPTDLIISVHFPRYPRIMKPLKIVLIWKVAIIILKYASRYFELTSGIPEPQA